MPQTVTALTREHVESYIEAVLDRTSASTAAGHYRRLQQLFRWLDEEGEIGGSPMARMKPPAIPEVPVPVLDEDALRRLLDACRGKTFEQRRDLAIISLFADTGMRLAELAEPRGRRRRLRPGRRPRHRQGSTPEGVPVRRHHRAGARPLPPRSPHPSGADVAVAVARTT